MKQCWLVSEIIRFFTAEVAEITAENRRETLEFSLRLSAPSQRFSAVYYHESGTDIGIYKKRSY